MKTFIDNKPHLLLARVRPAGLPFRQQNGSLIGLDFSTFDGSGMSNVRLNDQQARAIRDALNLYLTRGPMTITIARDVSGNIKLHEND